MTDKQYTRRAVVGIATIGIGSSLAGCTDIYREIGASADGSNDDSSGGQGGNGGASGNGGGSGSGGDSNNGGGDDSGGSSGSNDGGGGGDPSVPDEPWEEPEPINGPIDEGDFDDRINDVDIINTIENGNGYADFDVQVGANSWMKDVDPEPDEPGEPYFAVLINDVLVTRSDTVAYRKQGSWELDIPTGALQQFDAGELSLKILLLDTDKSRDDLFGRWTGTVTYQP